MKIGSKEWEATIRKGADELGVDVHNDVMRGFSLHARELVKFNRKMNLTAITDPFEIAIKHVIDSLSAAPYIPNKGALLDIGSGAGFPGIPIKLVRPDLRVTLIDGSARKISFLKHVIRSLNIDGITARHIRAEQMENCREGRFESVVIRAVASLEKCVRLALPLIKEGSGRIITLKGRIDTDEVKRLRRQIDRYMSGRQLEKMDYELTFRRFSLPLSNAQRAIVIVHCHR